MFGPRAPEPTRWHAFLGQLWPTDAESIAMLQEWLGYLLTPDTRRRVGHVPRREACRLDSGKRWREEDLPALGWRLRRHYDMRATFITLALDDGADPHMIETRVTHTKKSRTKSPEISGMEWWRRRESNASKRASTSRPEHCDQRVGWVRSARE